VTVGLVQPRRNELPDGIRYGLSSVRSSLPNHQCPELSGAKWGRVVGSAPIESKVVLGFAVSRLFSGAIRGKPAQFRLGNTHEGSIPFTRSIALQGLAKLCSKSAVKWG
jgi:hypothetical protein